jgi:Kef-type K+ transport system membrane component KefB
MAIPQVTVLFLDLVLIFVLAHALGVIARRLDQPAVIGEILAGILFGPTFFGGAITKTLFPTDVQLFLTALANVGVAVFMFAVGLELDQALLRGRGIVVAAVSAGSILVPFGLGVVLALYLVQNHPTTERLGFALFIGAAMSITAFPVLARILTDRNMHRTMIGGLALACAAVDDVLAWSLLAVAIVVADRGGPDEWLILFLAPYLLLMFGVVRPLMRRLVVRRHSAFPPFVRVVVAIMAGLFISSAMTQWMGLHFILGAFLFGLIMPREGAEQLREEIAEGARRFSGVVLPVFFLVAGLKVDLSHVDAGGLKDLALILLVAIGGKFTGAFLASRACGVQTRQSAAVATLMNTRGLTELVILSVGLQLGLLGRSLYSFMVVMAVVTTTMAGPLLAVIYPRQFIEQDRADAGHRMNTYRLPS